MPHGLLLCIQRSSFPSQLTTPSVKLLIDVALNQTWGGREGHAAIGASVASAKLGGTVSPDVARPLQAFDVGGRARQCRLNSKLHVVCDGPGASARAPPNTTTSSINSATGKQRHRTENPFARLKNRRRIATRYDRCGELFFSAVCIAATVMFRL